MSRANLVVDAAFPRSIRLFPDHAKLNYFQRYDDKTGCWNWGGHINKVTGYGYLGRRAAHRVAYEFYVGPVPAGLEIDHLCRNRKCFRPDHLEAVTHGENVRRGWAVRVRTHCKHGHVLAVLGRCKHGACRECIRLRARKVRAEKAAIRKAAQS